MPFDLSDLCCFFFFFSLFFFLVNLEDVKNIKIIFSSEDKENSLSVAMSASVFYSLKTGKGQAVRIDSGPYARAVWY